MIKVSKHARKRLSKRLNINRKAHERHTIKAFKLGKVVQSLENERKMLIEYCGREYIFGLDFKRHPILVTVI